MSGWWSALTPGAPEWWLPAAGLAGVVILLVLWSYRGSSGSRPLCLSAGGLKVLAIVALALCLIEPLYRGTRPRPGANVFVVAADNSRSLQILDRRTNRGRHEQMQEALERERPWLRRLEQDFEVRRYLFDARVRPAHSFENLDFTGSASSMMTAIENLPVRFGSRPVAGVLLFTDGNATDTGGQLPLQDLQLPVYPVVIGDQNPPRDLRVTRVSSKQTNFEAAPVTVTAEIMTHGFRPRRDPLVVQLLNEAGDVVEDQVIVDYEDANPVAVRFQLDPEHEGISFYRVRALAQADLDRFDPERPERIDESTLVNNERMFLVDRAGGPYRVLYVTGRPNWEFKFLRRALAEDTEVHLVGLVRIAKREPKFSFRARQNEDTNPIFRGFGNQADEEAEQYDQPVLLRLGTEDDEELRDGFPKTAEALFRYHAIILDDVESEFFTQDQQTLIQQFVTLRGGGFLMLGGQESFVKGKFDRTPIGEMLPVYLDVLPAVPADRKYRLSLTKEGWLQPWVRARSTEDEERRRLQELPGLRTLNRIRGIKPGATVLAQVQSQLDETYPALVVQPFGEGRTAALLVGDLWRWAMHRQDPEQNDQAKSWRQTARWLVADVPQRVEVATRHNPQANIDELRVTVRDARFRPLDNARVAVTVTTPDKRKIELVAEPVDELRGVYETSFVSRTSGGYRAQVIARSLEGEVIGEAESGWVSDPAVEEFAEVRANADLLRRIARDTGGEVIELDQLEDFVASLPNRKIPEVVSWTYPVWHQWSVFLFAVLCLAGEWGIRRWRGLP